MNRTYSLPPAAPYANHGHTRASWIFVALVLLGALVVSIGMVLYSLPTQIVGGVIIVAAAVLGIGFRAAGKGQPRTVVTRDWYED
ncbi:hypothetical protein SAMN02910418_01529 [Bowdeniella nasicola]|uniref:UsfY protein n=1 Tax=Bowdeniella nasicola TaxID=208480 RepID=A0A1H4AWS4_9ACTO|nr:MULTISPECIES: HGxxPAAW family protein [Bowdeniella]SEA40297.1 hypothetical protein SAMN02910418_01529 [Bowdeniella nasicola]